MPDASPTWMPNAAEWHQVPALPPPAALRAYWRLAWHTLPTCLPTAVLQQHRNRQTHPRLLPRQLQLTPSWATPRRQPWWRRPPVHHQCDAAGSLYSLPRFPTADLCSRLLQCVRCRPSSRHCYPQRTTPQHRHRLPTHHRAERVYCGASLRSTAWTLHPRWHAQTTGEG